MSKQVNAGSPAMQLPSMEVSVPSATTAEEAATKEEAAAPLVTSNETIEARMARMERSLAEQQTINANLAAENTRLKSLPQSAPKSSLAEIEEFNRREAERINAATTRVNAMIDQKEVELLEGDRKFNCWIDGENRMRKVVGAANEVYAKAKFQEYFGITAIANPKKQIQCSPFEAA